MSPLPAITTSGLKALATRIAESAANERKIGSGPDGTSIETTPEGASAAEPRGANIFSSTRRCNSLAICQLRRSRSEEHTSELQSLMRISYAVFCLQKKKKTLKNK